MQGGDGVATTVELSLTHQTRSLTGSCPPPTPHQMPLYKQVLIANAKASQEHLAGLLKKVAGVVNDGGGVIQRIGHFGVQDLAYPFEDRRSAIRLASTAYQLMAACFSGVLLMAWSATLVEGSIRSAVWPESPHGVNNLLVSDRLLHTHFTSTPDVMKEVERVIGLEDNIIRAATFKEKQHTLQHLTRNFEKLKNRDEDEEDDLTMLR